MEYIDFRDFVPQTPEEVTIAIQDIIRRCPLSMSYTAIAMAIYEAMREEGLR